MAGCRFRHDRHLSLGDGCHGGKCGHAAHDGQLRTGSAHYNVVPTFGLAATLYGVRALFNLLSIPVRQSYLMGIIDPAERSSAAGFANFPSQVTSAISPYLAGYFMEHLTLALPLEFAAAMQGLNTFLYWFFFRNVYPPEELDAGAAK